MLAGTGVYEAVWSDHPQAVIEPADTKILAKFRAPHKYGLRPPVLPSSHTAEIRTWREIAPDDEKGNLKLWLINLPDEVAILPKAVDLSRKI